MKTKKMRLVNLAPHSINLGRSVSVPPAEKSARIVNERRIIETVNLDASGEEVIEAYELSNPRIIGLPKPEDGTIYIVYLHRLPDGAYCAVFNGCRSSGRDVSLSDKDRGNRGEEETMCSRPRPIITLSIRKDSKLAKGRLPLHQRETEESIVVKVDPVSLCALLASVGKQYSIQEIFEEFTEMAQTSGDQPGEPQTESDEGES
jgi:hypothetical protein